MGIKDMIQDSLGYVTDEDRAKWEQKEQAVANDKAKRPSIIGEASQATLSGVLDHRKRQIDSTMRSAMINDATDRPKVRRRTIIEKDEVVAEYDKDGTEMEI